jgi:hypothetical protein
MVGKGERRIMGRPRPFAWAKSVLFLMWRNASGLYQFQIGPGICGANLESLQNAAFPFATCRRNAYRLARITEGFLP